MGGRGRRSTPSSPPSFRSLCGDVRWTAALTRVGVEGRCTTCEMHDAASTTANPVVGPMHAPPMDADLKKRVYAHRRRWNGTTYR